MRKSTTLGAGAVALALCFAGPTIARADLAPPPPVEKKPVKSDKPTPTTQDPGKEQEIVGKRRAPEATTTTPPPEKTTTTPIPPGKRRAPESTPPAETQATPARRHVVGKVRIGRARATGDAAAPTAGAKPGHGAAPNP